MRLTVVGCSGSVPGPDSACSGYLVEQDGYRLLLDLGTGAAGPLQRHAAPHEIDAVVISHGHGDHWSDLPDLGYLRTQPGLPVPRRPLTVVAPSDLPPVVWENPEVFDARVAEAGDLRLGPFDLRLARVEHTDQSFAVRVADTLCYTGDTAPCAALDELAAGCAVLLAEAAGPDVGRPRTGSVPVVTPGTLPGAVPGALPDARPGAGRGSPPGHLTAGDAGRLARRSGARLLVITHLRPWQDHGALLAEAAAEAGCPVVAATPHLRLEL